MDGETAETVDTTAMNPEQPADPAATPAATPENPAPKVEVPAIDPAKLLTPEGLQQYLATVSRLATENATLKAEKERQLAEERAKAEEARKRAMERAAEAGETKKLLELNEQKTSEMFARTQAQHEAVLKQMREQAEADRKRLADERTAAENRAKEVEQRSQQFALAAELGKALSGFNLVDGAAEDLTRLLKDQFVVVPEGNSFAVRTPTGQTVADALKTFLDLRPHYVRSSTTKGGTGVGPFAQQHQPDRAEPAAFEPRNLGEALVLHMKAAQKQQGDPSTNPSLPMGLRVAR